MHIVKMHGEHIGIIYFQAKIIQARPLKCMICKQSRAAVFEWL